jgi:hypothetical protein
MVKDEDDDFGISEEDRDKLLAAAGYTLADIEYYEARAKALAGLGIDSHRAAGVVAAALVEEELSDCIARHFVQDNGDYRQRISYMMHPDGVLGAFGAKIDLGWVMGIYGVAAYKNLKLIPKIRNAFAHKIAAGDFDCTLVGAHCDGLTFAEQFLEKNGPDYSATRSGLYTGARAASGRSVPNKAGPLPNNLRNIHGSTGECSCGLSDASTLVLTTRYIAPKIAAAISIANCRWGDVWNNAATPASIISGGDFDFVRPVAAMASAAGTVGIRPATRVKI